MLLCKLLVTLLLLSTRPASCKHWLTIGIPTISRPHEENYIQRSIQSLIATNLDHVRVVVFNAEGSTHAHFYECRAQWGMQKSFLFMDPETSQIQPLESRHPSDPNVPDARVRKQTRDIVALLRASVGISDYYLFLEDDMITCPRTLETIHYLITKMDVFEPHWIAIRTSFGMNGILMHDEDVGTFADYLMQHHRRRPPDHLVVEWFAGETDQSKSYKNHRPHIGYRYNLFQHLGTISSLRSAVSPEYPACMHELRRPIVFPVEAWDPIACPHDDTTPCKSQQYVANPRGGVTLAIVISSYSTEASLRRWVGKWNFMENVSGHLGESFQRVVVVRNPSEVYSHKWFTNVKWVTIPAHYALCYEGVRYMNYLLRSYGNAFDTHRNVWPLISTAFCFQEDTAVDCRDSCWRK